MPTECCAQRGRCHLPGEHQATGSASTGSSWQLVGSAKPSAAQHGGRHLLDKHPDINSTRRPDPTPEPKIESRRVTLECQTLKVREPVRRSFVTDLAKFRHLFIRQPGGFVTRVTGSKSPKDIAQRANVLDRGGRRVDGDGTATLKCCLGAMARWLC